MRDKIYCLMTASVSLTPTMADTLFDTACAMIKGDTRKKRFRVEGFEGVVTTQFESKSLHGVCGDEFFAEVESELGKGSIKFLVREADAKVRNELAWVPLSFMEDVPMGLDPTPSRQKPMYN